MFLPNFNLLVAIAKLARDNGLGTSLLNDINAVFGANGVVPNGGPLPLFSFQHTL